MTQETVDGFAETPILPLRTTKVDVEAEIRMMAHAIVDEFGTGLHSRRLMECAVWAMYATGHVFDPSVRSMEPTVEIVFFHRGSEAPTELSIRRPKKIVRGRQ
jgi:hypothetical protein